MTARTDLANRDKLVNDLARLKLRAEELGQKKDERAVARGMDALFRKKCEHLRRQLQETGDQTNLEEALNKAVCRLRRERKEERRKEEEILRKVRKQERALLACQLKKEQREKEARERKKQATQFLKGKAAAYHREFLTLEQKCDWRDQKFDLHKAACLSQIAQLAYCVISSAEKGIPRVTIVPSDVYRQAFYADYFDANVLRAIGIDDPFFFSGANFVAFGVVLHNQFFVGVRGSATIYDWLCVNLRVTKKIIPSRKERLLIHGGFLTEAQTLVPALHSYLTKKISAKESSEIGVWLTGHSLGGAVAAILHEFQGLGFQVRGSYIFGAPRVAERGTVAGHSTVFAIRRVQDIVPCLPPPRLGYDDYLSQWTTNGEPYPSSLARKTKAPGWADIRRPYRLYSDHKMALYEGELTSAVGNQ